MQKAFNIEILANEQFKTTPTVKKTIYALACSLARKLLPESARRTLFLLAVGVLMPAGALATEYDLSLAGSQSLNVLGDFGGTAIVADYWSQPTGTGVFDPFLTLDANGKTSTGLRTIESAYNADGHNQLYLDGIRPSWNTTLRFGDLARVQVGLSNYFAFILDANEPGAAKSVISIDNIRIYTSATDNTANVQNDLTKLNNLGTLRWALNDPLRIGNTTNFNIVDWIKLDASQENINKGSNGGSGNADMIVYIPEAAFGNALSTDFVWFYNLNGVHYSVDSNLAAQAGFEEWSAVVRAPNSTRVPDGGITILLLGLGLLGIGYGVRSFGVAKY